MADLPIGSIVMFDGVTPPPGWYDCDGAVRGGITTPNLQGAFPKGVPAGGTLGVIGGSASHQHSNQNTGVATHGHGQVSGNSGAATGNTVGGIWAGGTYSGVGAHQHLLSIAAVTNQTSHQHTLPNTNSGSSLPPYIRLRYIMRCE